MYQNCDYQTDRHMNRQMPDKVILTNYSTMCRWHKNVLFKLYRLYWYGLNVYNRVAAFQGMHVSPAKHSYAWLPRKRDYRTDTHTDGQTDARESDPYVPLCFAGDTKNPCAFKQRKIVKLPSESHFLSFAVWLCHRHPSAHLFYCSHLYAQIDEGLFKISYIHVIILFTFQLVQICKHSNGW